MKARTLLAGAGFCVFVVVAIQSADRFLFRRGAAAVAAHVNGLTFAAVSAAPWRAEARIDGVIWRRAGSTIHVGALKFVAPPFFPLAGAALAGFGAASAEDVTVEAGLSVYRIKRIELVGAAISSAELLQIFDLKNAVPAAERVAKLTAASIAIPEMTVETKAGTSTQTFVYHDILLNGLAGGRAADANVAGISFSIADPQGDADGAYGKISARDVDLVLATRIIGETRDQPDAPKLPLVKAIDIDSFHLGGASGELDLRRLTAAAGTGRPPARPWREAAAVAGRRPDVEQRNALLAAFLDAFGFDDLAVTDIQLGLRKEENPTRLTIGGASISRLDGLRIEGIEAKNLVFERPTGRIGLETLSVRGLDLAPLTSADQEPNLLGKGLRPDFEQIALSRLEGRFGSSGGVDAASPPAFEVERFAIETSAKDPARSGLNVSLDHLKAPIAEEGAFSTLAAMGYADLDLSSRLDVDWSEATSELTVNSFSLNGADMGSLNVAAQFSNVTPDLASKDEQVAAMAAHGVLIKKLDLRLENAGFIDKALAFQAKTDKQSLDEARQADVLRASLLLPALLGNEPPARALGSALAKFIAAPKNFSLQALAAAGIGVADIELVQTPGALLKKIEVTAAANE